MLSNIYIMLVTVCLRPNSMAKKHFRIPRFDFFFASHPSVILFSINNITVGIRFHMVSHTFMPISKCQAKTAQSHICAPYCPETAYDRTTGARQGGRFHMEIGICLDGFTFHSRSAKSQRHSEAIKTQRRNKDTAKE